MAKHSRSICTSSSFEPQAAANREGVSNVTTMGVNPFDSRRGFFKAVTTLVLSCTSISSAIATSSSVESVVWVADFDQHPVDIDSHAVGQILDVRAIYGLVKAVFGLSIVDTARLFGVHRKTLHEWAASDDIPNVRRETLDRAVMLERVAHAAAKKLQSKVAADATISFNGNNLFEIAAREPLTEAPLLAWIDKLAEERRAAPVSRTSLLVRLQNAGVASPVGSDAVAPLV